MAKENHARIEGARQLPTHHITIRVPWHDHEWDGTVCREPGANTQCLILARIADGKRDDEEARVAGKRLSMLQPEARPPCVDEHATFMDSQGITLKKRHPYATIYPNTYGVFDETPLEILPWSAAVVPFRWMLRAAVEGDEDHAGKAASLKLGYTPVREDEIARLVRDEDGRELKSQFIQHFDNQQVMLDTFFSAVESETSLCFFYAKRTPLAEDRRRVIVAVGRVCRVGLPTEYRYNAEDPTIRGMFWERCVVHSIRPSFEDGFVLPYSELLARASGDPSIDLASMVAFAPDECFEQFSYGSELLPHDGAIAALVSVAASLHRIHALLGPRWDGPITWVNSELNRLWKARGAFPGLGSALTAFGLLEHGTLIAYEVAAQQARDGVELRESPWTRVEAIFRDPQKLPAGLRRVIGRSFQEKWASLPPGRRALLELLSRFTLSAAQATRWYQPTARREVGVILSDGAILENPYVLYEGDRTRPDPIGFAVVDRGMWPADDVRNAFPVPPPSVLDDAIDRRRVRALVVDTLERASAEGHTLFPRDRLILRVRDAGLLPACPLDEDTLDMVRASLEPAVVVCSLDDGSPAYQLDRYATSQRMIAKLIRDRVRGRRAGGDHPWRKLVDDAFVGLARDPVEEDRARREKATVLEEIFRARVSVLLGPAGTGKTTLLQILCQLREVNDGGVLLLAPTGKARVRLEEATRRRGEGMTLAQFLLRFRRYDGETGRYFVNPDAPRAGGHRTVIIDECSMLTEDQLAALLDAISGVDRLVLVGDPRQLPPIGAGRPFVDVVRELAPPDVETRFPRVAEGYGELTVVRRQDAGRDDALFAQLFGGTATKPDVDDLWDRIARGQATGVRAAQWRDGRELQEKLFAEIKGYLQRTWSGHDENDRFALSLGASLYAGRMYFWAGRDGQLGAAGRAQDWQVLSPLRAGPFGVETINREVQRRYRATVLEMARADARRRLVPKPAGPEGIVWGDKVINLVNSGRRRTYPKLDDAYVANGDLGIVVGEFRTKTYKGRLENLEVEFSTVPGIKFTYWRSELTSEEGSPPVELAYALTVHKTQGSQFGQTFVVIPDPCRVLSREMLYTALTRQRDDLVILHQQPLRELGRYTDAFYSDVARRMTNLFKPASPREVRSRHEPSRPRYLESGLVHRTELGELVRSKSELLITSVLHARDVKYLYEEPLTIHGWRCLPDFTIRDENRGITFYWEHLGLLDDPKYAMRWEAKLAEYRRVGVRPYEEGGGPEGVLLRTRDEVGGALDASRVAKLVDEVILGDWRVTYEER